MVLNKTPCGEDVIMLSDMRGKFNCGESFSYFKVLNEEFKLSTRKGNFF
jgi:hypothetical protein